MGSILTAAARAGRRRFTLVAAALTLLALAVLGGGALGVGAPAQAAQALDAPGAGQGSSAAPAVADAFAYLSPCDFPVTPGSSFTVDLMVNGGTNTVAGQQSYLTFDSSLLQVVSPSLGCGNPVTTVQADTSSLEVVLQNTVNNTTGEIAYASGTFGSGATGTFRVARITFCALAAGVATVHWQFSPPDPPQRNSKITDVNAATVSNPALYQDCTITEVGATPTNTAVVPTHTATNTPTNTAVVPTHTATNTPTNTAVGANAHSD